MHARALPVHTCIEATKVKTEFVLSYKYYLVLRRVAIYYLKGLKVNTNKTFIGENDKYRKAPYTEKGNKTTWLQNHSATQISRQFDDRF